MSPCCIHNRGCSNLDTRESVQTRLPLCLLLIGILYARGIVSLGWTLWYLLGMYLQRHFYPAKQQMSIKIGQKMSFSLFGTSFARYQEANIFPLRHHMYLWIRLDLELDYLHALWLRSTWAIWTIFASLSVSFNQPWIGGRSPRTVDTAPTPRKIFRHIELMKQCPSNDLDA